MAILMMTIYVKNSKNHILASIKASRLKILKFLVYPKAEFREISKLSSLNIIEKIIEFTLYMISQIFQ